MPYFDLDPLLGAMLDAAPAISDLNLSVGRPPQVELDGARAFLVSVEDGHALIACGNRLLALDWPVKKPEPDRVARFQ